MRPAAIIPIFVLSSAALSQTLTPAQSLQPVDPQHGDINSLRTSTRDMRPDLRVPTGFDRVYRVPGSTRGVGFPGSPADALGAPRYERISGGLTAVFSASEYITNKDGKTIPITPAGTVYYIGGVPRDPVVAPPTRTSPLAAITRVSQFVDTLEQREATPGRAAVRADFSFDHAGTAQPTLAPNSAPPPKAAPATTTPPDSSASAPAKPAEPRPSGGILGNEQFRKQRIQTLLASAADASAGTP